jgi:GH15 family glucan-1,4-alpha-glucosidase
MAYLPIESYGLIGNMRSAALVGINGSIDWLCLPRFDSPSIFGAILDDAKGGRLRIAPVDGPAPRSTRQLYWPRTNVLVTRHLATDAVAEVIDFMPVGEPPHLAGSPIQPPALIRLCHGTYGRTRMRLTCRPGFDYAAARHQTHVSSTGAAFNGPGATLMLGATVPLRPDGQGGVEAEFVLGAGEWVAVEVRWAEGSAAQTEPIPPVSVHMAREYLDATVQFWRRWISACTYRGRWREMVERSALVLKLLTYEPTGAIVAAPTTSLPAPIGGVRNWDYRYTWIRDAAFTAYGLVRVGFTREVVAFMDWVLARFHELEPDGMLRPLYGIDGRHEIPERTLDHLEGYRGSRPVRIGNAAADQVQLDIVGELLDAVYLHNKYAEPLGYATWTQVCRIADWVCRNWRRADHGVWEVRGPPREFVYSKVMCWVALDRALRLADRRSFPGNTDLWRRTRDEIYRTVQERGFDPRSGAFVQAFDRPELDAANLIMPLVFFMSPADARMLGTIDRIAEPASNGGLMSDTQVFRYIPEQTDDGLPGNEGGFNMCTFWLIEAQTRAGRFRPERLEKARMLFEKVLGHANHLGLYAEQTGMLGEALGNFPQAFTHLSFISAAFNLDRVLGEH